MLERTSIWLDKGNMKALEAIARKSGGLKPSQLVRIAVNEFVRKARKSSVN
jgi:metal-responsive CopG/Arc/MetJ family transcriptional regulator